MAIEVEIIPARANPLTAQKLQSCLRRKRGLACSVDEGPLDDTAAIGECCTVGLGSSSFFLRKSSAEFADVPAIEYLVDELSKDLDLDRIAQNWDRLGFSYFLSPDDGTLAEEDFVDLCCAVADAAEGVIMAILYVGPWCTGGLYSSDQFWQSFQSSGDSRFERPS